MIFKKVKGYDLFNDIQLTDSKNKSLRVCLQVLGKYFK